MTLEIERKFLCSLTKEQVNDLAFDSRYIRSIYLENTPKGSFRVVRDILSDGTIKCKWTEKRSTNSNVSRVEIEEELPEIIFRGIDNQGFPTINKERFLIKFDNHIWEIDFFEEYDFIIAELEFDTIEEANSFTDFPSWIIEEVTDSPSYLNCNLAKV